MKRDPVQIIIAFSGLTVLAALTLASGRIIENRLVPVIIPTYLSQINFPWHFIGQSIFLILLGASGHKLFTHFYPNTTQISQQEKSSYNAFRSRTYPNPFPNGWYSLMYSDELEKGEIKQINALGRQFAIFRGKSGKIGIADAYCPHMGANLTVGGKVYGDYLECPFHKWKFNLEGKCISIPYTDRAIPKNANLRSYHCVEYHSMICVYFDAENREPAYELPIQPAIENGDMVYRGRLDAGIVQMHIQEFADNSADWMHFDPIHGKMMIPFTRFEIPFISRWLRIDHQPGIAIGNEPDASKYGPTDKHFLYFLNRGQLLWCGKPIPETSADAVITFCGPAGITFFRFIIPHFGQIIMFQTHLPEDDVKQRVRFHWYSDRSLSRVLVWYVVGLWVSQWTNDIDIWENKIHFRKPCIVSGDGPITKVRRWYKQFYSDHSGEMKNNPLEW